MRFGQRGCSWLARRRIEGVGSRFSGRWGKIIELSSDERERFEFGLLQAHGDVLDSLVVGSIPFRLTSSARQARAANSKTALLAGANRRKTFSCARPGSAGCAGIQACGSQDKGCG